MRSWVLRTISALGAASIICSAASAGTQSKHYSVELNKTEVVYLPQAAGAVVIGNPDIADISIHSADTIFVIGRGFGETNLIVLNAAGQMIMNADVQVTNSLPAHGVRLYNGTMRQTYSCAPYCQPAPILGDQSEFIADNTGMNDTITNTASSAPPTNTSSRESSSSRPPDSFSPQPPSF